MPDTELFQLAKEDQLQEDEKLVERVGRMPRPVDKGGLRRGKGSKFATNFIEQWLGTCFGPRIQPADHSQPSMILSLKANDMVIFFFEHLLSKTNRYSTYRF